MSDTGDAQERQVSIQQPEDYWYVKNNNFIKQDGVFTALNDNMISSAGLADSARRMKRPPLELQQQVHECDVKAASLRPYLRQLVEDHSAARLLMDSESLESFDIEKALQAPEQVTARIKELLDHGLDKELLPLVWVKYMNSNVSETLVGQILIPALIENGDVAETFKNLLVDDQFVREANIMQPMDGSNGNKVRKLIKQVLEHHEAQSGPMSVDEYYEARAHFINFFTSEWESEFDFSELRSHLQDITADMYGVHSYSLLSKGFSLQEDSPTPDFYIQYYHLRQNALNREKRAYFRSTFDKTMSGIQQAFPDLYIQGLIDCFEVSTLNKRLKGDTNCLVDNATYGNGTIAIYSGTDIPDLSDYAQIGLSQHNYVGEALVKRRVGDMVTIAHEWAHGRFERNETKKVREEVNYPNVALSAVNEGFAVMVELLIIKKAIETPELFGLAAEDIADLKKVRQWRVRDLKTELNAYSEGT
jgi:hypothetical protein